MSNLTPFYHGTIFPPNIFGSIDISKGKGYKDFGPGFYITESIRHAASIAKRNANRTYYLHKYGNIIPYVYQYEIDKSVFNNYCCRIFDKSAMTNDDWIDWIDIIVASRNSEIKCHGYDVVVGPTTDDNATSLITSYITGGMGDVNSRKTKLYLRNTLKTYNYPTQTYIGNQMLANYIQSCFKRFIDANTI